MTCTYWLRCAWRGVLHGIAIAVFCCSNSAVLATDKQSVATAVLKLEGRGTAAVANLAKRIWQRNDPPILLILYCSAAFDLADLQAGCGVDTASPRQVQEFALALWHVWTGKTRQARGEFEALSRDPDWRHWGDIGLLEWAAHTGNVSLLEQMLRARSASVPDRDAKANEDYGSYQFHAALLSGNWKEIDRLIANARPDSVSSVPWIFKAHAYSLYARGREHALRDALRKARPALGKTSTYVLMKAYHADLASGMRAAHEVLNSATREKEPDRGLSLQSAYADIMYGSSEESSRALEAVMKAAREMRRDASILLDIAVSLSLFRKQDQSIAVRRLIDASRDDLEEFTAFHVYEAWEAVYAGNLSEARQHVSGALARAPMDLEANRLKALIAKREDDAKSGAEAIRALLIRDPYNENHANILLHFLRQNRTSEIEALYKIVLGRADRYSPEFRQKLLGGKKVPKKVLGSN